MSMLSPESELTPASTGAGSWWRRVASGWVVAGVAMGGCVAFGLMWQNECRRATYWEAQVAPLKAEAARYRVGLQEEIARTMRLAEDLRARQAADVSVR